MNSDRFSPCPNRPNCVSSKERPGGRHVKPISYSGDSGSAMKTLLSLLQGQHRVRLVENETGYIHAVFRSRLFGFADDVEFELDSAAQLIHIKSASRVGNWDLGVNRRRCEAIRSAFNQAQKTAGLAPRAETGVN